MADISPTPLAEIIGEGRDAGPGAKPEAQQQQSQAQPSASEPQLPPPPSEQLPPPPDREEQPGAWAYAALKDERQKRQSFQAQVQQLQQERDAAYAMLQQQQQPQPQQHQLPDMFSDPEGYHRFLLGQVTDQLRTQEQNFSFRLQHDKYGEDFEKAYNAMLQLAQAGDPSVVRWTMSTPDPGKALMLWYQQAQQQQPQRAPLMPSNLSSARSVGQRSGPAWSGPTPLADIFDRRGK